MATLANRGAFSDAQEFWILATTAGLNLLGGLIALYGLWEVRRRRNRWPRDAGLRLDHLLLSKKLARRLRTAGIDRDVRGVEGASDHAPVWITLKD